MAAPLGGSEFSRLDAILEYFPLRGVALTLILGSIWAIALVNFQWPPLEYAWVAVVLVGFLACMSENMHRQDRLTSQGIERRSGILGRRKRLVRFEAMESVDVEEPGRGFVFDVGTVVVRLDGAHERLVAITAPHEVTRIITQARDAAIDQVRVRRPTKRCTGREPLLYCAPRASVSARGLRR